MVTFIPPYIGQKIKSNAERKMFDTFKDLNLENAYVFHSVNLPKHVSKIYGEVDFVVVCEYGVACLEVKGGRVARKEGEWEFTNGNGDVNVKTEGPFQQVKNNMSELFKQIKAKFPGNREIKSMLPVCGVMFPDIEFVCDSEEEPQDMVYDKNTANITAYIKHIFKYWYGRKNREPVHLSEETVTMLVNYIRGDFVFVPTLESRLSEIEERLYRLTSEQARVMSALGVNKHLLIEGRAGTGKTFLAIEYAKQKAMQGKKVLFLTFNKNLVRHISSLVEQYTSIKVINIHALFGEYVKVDVKKLKENPNSYFEKDLPEAFFDYICSLSDEKLNNLKYDVIVMDEGQDIVKPLYIDTLDALLKGGLENGDWAVFYDEEQNIYNNEDYIKGMDMLRCYNNVRFPLYTNCRNTAQIGNYSSELSGIKFDGYIQADGEDVRNISYSDTENFKKKIEELVEELKSQGVKPKDIVFLGPRVYEGSKLKEIGFAVNELGDNFDPRSKAPVYSTIHGFKGLDSKVAFIIDVEQIKEKNFSRYMYVSGTRARALLYVVGSKEFWKEHRPKNDFYTCGKI